jgi:hypothetical protein
MSFITHSKVHTLYPKATFVQKRALISSTLYIPHDLAALGFSLHKGCDIQEVVEQKIIRWTETSSVLKSKVVQTSNVLCTRSDAPAVYPRLKRSIEDRMCWTRNMTSRLCDLPTNECVLSRYVRQTSVGWEPYISASTWTVECLPYQGLPTFEFNTHMYYHPRLMQGTCLGGYHIQLGPAHTIDINDFTVERGERAAIRSLTCHYTPISGQ